MFLDPKYQGPENPMVCGPPHNFAYGPPPYPRYGPAATGLKLGGGAKTIIELESEPKCNINLKIYKIIYFELF